jgi:hypothetical protein
MKHRCVPWVLAAGLLAVPICQAELYRWVDEHGQTHFADSPPHSQPHEIAVRPPPAAAQSPQRRVDKTRRLLNAFEHERQQQREQTAKKKQQAEEQHRNCLQARDNLRQYRESGSIYRLDDRGERVYLSDHQRATLILEYQDAVARHCR